MGGTLQKNVNSLEAVTVNSILNTSKAQCNPTCTAVRENTQVYIGGGNFRGGVNITQECSAQARCVISQSLTTTTETVQKQQSGQKNSDIGSLDIFGAIFGSSQENVTIEKQYINNRISNIMSATCSADTTLIDTDSKIYIGATNFSGGLVLLQKGNSQSECSIKNMSSISVYNNQQQKAEQSNTKIGIIAIILIIIVICIIIVVAIFFLFGGASFMIHEVSGSSDTAGPMGSSSPLGPSGSSGSMGSSSPLGSLGPLSSMGPKSSTGPLGSMGSVGSSGLLGEGGLVQQLQNVAKAPGTTGKVAQLARFAAANPELVEAALVAV